MQTMIRRLQAEMIPSKACTRRTQGLRAQRSIRGDCCPRLVVTAATSAHPLTNSDVLYANNLHVQGTMLHPVSISYRTRLVREVGGYTTCKSVSSDFSLLRFSWFLRPTPPNGDVASLGLSDRFAHVRDQQPDAVGKLCYFSFALDVELDLVISGCRVIHRILEAEQWFDHLLR